MKNPLPLLSVWSAEYINTHIDEMMTILSRKVITLLEDATNRGSNRYAQYGFRELRNGRIYLTTEFGEGVTFNYKDVGILEITAEEINMAIETQKQLIGDAEKEISKFNTWREYMKENNMAVFNVNKFNELYLLSVLKNVKESASDLSVEDLKKIVSSLMN